MVAQRIPSDAHAHDQRPCTAGPPLTRHWQRPPTRRLGWTAHIEVDDTQHIGDRMRLSPRGTPWPSAWEKRLARSRAPAAQSGQRQHVRAHPALPTHTRSHAAAGRSRTRSRPTAPSRPSSARVARMCGSGRSTGERARPGRASPGGATLIQAHRHSCPRLVQTHASVAAPCTDRQSQRRRPQGSGAVLGNYPSPISALNRARPWPQTQGDPRRLHLLSVAGRLPALLVRGRRRRVTYQLVACEPATCWLAANRR